MRIILTLLVLQLGFAGCVTLGRPFDAVRVAGIKVGTTTERDLIRSFGEPYRRGLDDGDDTATWIHYKLRLFGDRNTRDLYIRLNAEGTIKSYSFNSNFPGDQDVIRKSR
ncbi:MAG: hypothetical protein ABIJ96_04365 [Elusimicrobiota bacterium]